MFIEVRNIDKFFGDLKALDNVSMYFRPGEIVGILGENGAGKTTLLNIVFGLYRPDSGHIVIDGEVLRYTTPSYSTRKKIFFVQQFPRLVETMSAVENGMILLKRGRDEVVKTLRDYSERYGIGVELGKRVHEMTVLERQKLYTLLSLAQGARAFLLDEPNVLLTNDPGYVEFLHRFSKREGGTIVVSSHKIHAVINVSDRIYVMRRGRVVGEYREVSRDIYDEILDLMFGNGSGLSAGSAERLYTGQGIVERRDTERGSRRDIILRTRGLIVRNDIGEIDLEVASGEIVSVVSIAGRGDRDLFEVIAGVRRPLRGSIELFGREATGDPTYERVSRGVVYIPDNKLDLVNPRYRIREMLGLWGIESREEMTRCLEKTGVLYRSLESQVSELSGGNITRLLVSIALCKRPRLIVSHNIFSGLDYRGYVQTTRLLRDMCREGTGLLLIQNDYEEAVEVSDRIYVLSERGSRELSLQEIKRDPRILWREMVS